MCIWPYGGGRMMLTTAVSHGEIIVTTDFIYTVSSVWLPANDPVKISP